MAQLHSRIKHPDWWIVLIYFLLVVFGWMNIYSTRSEDAALFDLSRKHGAQLMWIVIAFFSATAVMIISSQFYSVFSYFIYGTVTLVLLSVLLIGIEVNGSKSWLAFGSFRFQPTELAKMATSLALARFMSSYEFKLNTLKSWLGIATIVAFPVLLILLQKDWGSAIVFSCFLLMFYREGMSGWVLFAVAFMVILFIVSLLIPPVWVVWWLLLGTILLFAVLTYLYQLSLIFLGAVTLPLFLCLYFLVPAENIDDPFLYRMIAGGSCLLVFVGMVYGLIKRIKGIFYIALFFFGTVALNYSVDYIFDNVLKSHHRDRIEDMIGIKEDIRGAGYNVYQSKVAIGSGGFTGKGYLEGTQTKLNFVPEQSTDFIFCTIGEEWGYLGSVATLSLFLLLLIRIVLLAERQKDVFARVYGYCVASIIFFHFSINIAMTIGLAPVIGIPLPFISAGGSSLWSFTILLFIFLKFDSVRYGEQ